MKYKKIIYKIFNRILTIFKNLSFFLFGIFTAAVMCFLFLIIYVNSAKNVEVPYLIGENINVAFNALKEKNLIPNIVGTGDKVLYTDPKPGSIIKHGQHVIVQLIDLEKQEVPDLLNIPIEIGELFLQEFGINYQVRRNRTTDMNKNGLILSINPIPGSKINDNVIIINVGVYGE